LEWMHGPSFVALMQKDYWDATKHFRCL
jgi:hypothetical protein